jgi:hypothetical protein
MLRSASKSVQVKEHGFSIRSTQRLILQSSGALMKHENLPLKLLRSRKIAKLTYYGVTTEQVLGSTPPGQMLLRFE